MHIARLHAHEGKERDDDEKHNTLSKGNLEWNVCDFFKLPLPLTLITDKCIL